jgi:hypothetical protein
MYSFVRRLHSNFSHVFTCKSVHLIPAMLIHRHYPEAKLRWGFISLLLATHHFIGGVSLDVK